MKQKRLFISDLNVGVFLVFLFALWVTYLLTWDLSEKEVYKYIALISYLFLVYIGLNLWVNICYLYEDHIEIIYVFRFRKRKVCYKYGEISRIRYFNTVSRFEQPTLKIFIKKDSSKTKTYEFPLRFYKKRRAILRHLKSKGISIEIDSVLEKDYRIFMPSVKLK